MKPAQSQTGDSEAQLEPCPLENNDDLLELASDLYWEQDAACRFTRVIRSRFAADSLESTFAISGKKPWELPGVLAVRGWDALHAAVSHRRPYRDLQWLHRNLRGETQVVSVSAQPAFDGQVFIGYRGIMRDMTRQWQEAVTTRRYRQAMDLSGESIYLVDRSQMRFIDVNETACRAAGYSREEMLTLGPQDLLLAERADIERAYEEVIAAGMRGTVSESVARNKHGKEYVFELQRRAFRSDGTWIIVSIAREITRRKRAEDSALRLGRMYAAISATNEAMLHARSPQELYQQVCDAAVDGGKLVTAAVLVPDPDSQWVKVAAVTGMTAERLLGARVSFHADLPQGHGLVGTAYRSLQPCVSNDVVNDTRMLPWRHVADANGVAAGAAFPLARNGQAAGVLLLYSSEKDAFDPEIVTLLTRMAENLAFALENFERNAERQRVLAHLRESEERFRDLTELSSDWYWEQDAEHRFTQVSGDIFAKTGSSPEEYLGKALWELPHVEVSDEAWAQHRALLARHEPFQDLILKRIEDGKQSYFRINGLPVFDTEGVLKGYRGTGKDITERMLADERVRYLASHDGLTALPNRMMFTQMLSLAVQHGQRYGRQFAVMFIDLDNFKGINDTVGHAGGDSLLKAVAMRLKQCVRASDLVARLAGDEFVVLIQEVSEEEQVVAIAQKIVATLLQPVLLSGLECQVTASIGISMFPRDGEDEDALLKRADSAMYRAKRAGKNNFRFHSAGRKSD